MLRELDRIEEPFTTPANAGPLPQANAVGSFGSIRWGDAVKLMLRVEPSGRIAEASFQAFGGSSAITTSSAAARIVTGKTLDEAAAVTAADIAESAGGLPRHRMYCAVMNYEALQRAIADYRGDKSLAEADSAPACKCLGVGQMLIERTIRFNRLTSLDEVTDYTKAASSCSSCFKQVETLLARVNAEMVEDGLIEPAKAYRPGSSPQRAIDLKPTGAPAPAANIFAAKAAPAHLRAAPKSPPPKPAPVPGAAQVDAPPQGSADHRGDRGDAAASAARRRRFASSSASTATSSMSGCPAIASAVSYPR
ncbi:iron-sulfur cluster assembly scaffold protein [Rhodopseudomonas sp. B29]|uniref:iron-sulfur cluster assembly scaffold protein n=1 Tax=Rhodopseudomonas sp. B29 TaxID=95607 RepID=UPI00034897FD|nr:iron-sulfur cluster assembly scaffold protein [Rhodopseudomonas sp. B29]